MTDIERAFRGWRRAPGFTAVAVLTLGLAIGLSTTMFSVVAAVVMPPSEFPAPDRLVTLSETSDTELCAGCGVGTSWPTWADWQQATRAYASMAAYVETPVVVSRPLPPARMAAARASAGLFATLGTAMAMGREFAPADTWPGAAPVVVLGDALWRTGFAADPRVIGDTVRVDGVPHTIVGVAPAGVKFPEVAELWLPLQRVAEGPGATRDDRSLGVVARLADRVSVDHADAELRAVSARLAATVAEQRGWSAAVRTLADDRADETGTAFLALLGAVGLVLAVASANLGALWLARAARAERELAVRAALGASRGRLIRQRLTESLLLGCAGGVLGLGLAVVGVRVVAAGISGPVPYYVRFAIDWRVLIFAVGASVLTGVLAGLPPAIAASRPNLVRGLRLGGASGAGADGRQRRWQQALLVAELALVLVLLAGAALMGKTLARFRQPPAYAMDGLTRADVPWGGARYADAAAVAAASASLESMLVSEPGWRAGFTHQEFLRGFGAVARVAETDAGPMSADRAPRFGFSVTPGYFAALGLPLVAGRAFDARDRAGAEPVVIVNRSLAEAAWPGVDAVGRRLKLPVEGESVTWRRVVGVVADVDLPPGGGRRTTPLAYLPYAQLARRPVDVVVRAGVPSERVGELLQQMVGRIDPDEPVVNVRSEARDRARQYWEITFLATLYTVFAGFALLVAAVGLYGAVSQNVTERLREFGVRLALGAPPARLVALVLGQTARLAMAGVVIGLAGAALSTRALGAMLYGTNPVDPAVFAGVAAGLAAVVIAAGFVPAWRASRVNPLTVLRQE